MVSTGSRVLGLSYLSCGGSGTERFILLSERLFLVQTHIILTDAATAPITGISAHFLKGYIVLKISSPGRGSMRLNSSIQKGWSSSEIQLKIRVSLPELDIVKATSRRFASSVLYSPTIT